MNQIPKICMQCGAPLKGFKCEYCDTIYYDAEGELARMEAEMKRLQWHLMRQETYSQMIDQLGSTDSWWLHQWWQSGGAGGI